MLAHIVTAALLIFLIWVSYHDLRHYEIKPFVHPVVMAMSFFVTDLTPVERLIGGAVCFLPVFTAAVITGGGIGGGDAKLLFAFGFTLGAARGTAAMLLGLIFHVVCHIPDIAGKKKIKRALAPWLSAGFAVFLFL
jgi:Flp pilus assembly protein protease CpaA